MRVKKERAAYRKKNPRAWRDWWLRRKWGIIRREWLKLSKADQKKVMALLRAIQKRRR